MRIVSNTVFSLLLALLLTVAPSGVHIAQSQEDPDFVLDEDPRGTGSAKSHTSEDEDANCNDIVGRWRWHTGAIVGYFNNKRWQTPDGAYTGTWQCRSENEIVITFDKGGWIDTVTISEDGRTLSGRNQEGARVSANRILQ